MKSTKMLAILVLALVVGLTARVVNAKLVACVGDSITYGVGIPNRNYNSYPAQLARILQQVDKEWQSQNFGVSGATLLTKGWKPYTAQGAYNGALASEPEVVIILLGTNDSKAANWVYKDDFITDFLALIDAFAQLPSQPKIFVCYPPPVFWSSWGHIDIVIREEIIPLIDQLPTYRAVEVIDLYTPLKDSPHLFPDGVHPNTEGAKLMAEIVAATILGLRGHPDLNGDGVVDCADICIMVEHWHTDEPAYDIAPPPFGDGIVDVQDLIALAEYLLTYPGAVAYWKLDETKGFIAQDSVGDCNGTLIGGPAWKPTDGMVAGALQFDGIDDYVSAPFVLNPAAGVFSIFAWIKGGGPGQTVISQTGGANWLCVDPSDGKLMTELKGLGRFAPPQLVSEFVISDGDWHRIGFVWDGSNRMLYVDDVEVARDTQSSLAGSTGGSHIGAGKGLEAGSFFSGLIDDVRIYNRAVSP